MSTPAISALAVALGLACGCNDPAHVTLVPLGGDCARPAKAIAVKITAYAPDGEHSESVGLDASLAISDFPADTEQLAVEVQNGGGALGAAGKSAPLAFGALGNATQIPVFMAPPDGFCPVGALGEPRARPLVARAGSGVLVVGGTGAAGPLSSAEYYDPATATWAPVEVPPVLVDPQGFTGTALATLPDGKVALIGGPQRAFVEFDPATRAFTTAPTLIEGRAFHAAIAEDDGDILVAGGCVGVEAGVCSGVARHQIVRYDPSRLTDVGVDLPQTDDQRVSAQLFDLGVQVDGRRGYLLAGGTSVPARVADRFALDDAMTAELAGGFAQAAALDGGAVLTAFDPDAASAIGAAAVFAPYAPADPGAAARMVAAAQPASGARLVALEDGRVAAFGGDPDGVVRFYDPTRDVWTASPGDPGPVLAAPSLVRLADGAILVLDGGAASTQAWLYRPSLVGPASGSVTAVPVSPLGKGVLTAPDPAQVIRDDAAAEWRLRAPGDGELAMARALVGGPRTAIGSVRAVASVRAGGVALIARQTAPGHAVIAELVPGQPPKLVQLDGGAAQVVCSGSTILPAFNPALAVTLRLAISDHDAQIVVDDAVVLGCALGLGDRGAWGIASLGTGGAGGDLAVASVTVARRGDATDATTP